MSDMTASDLPASGMRIDAGHMKRLGVEQPQLASLIARSSERLLLTSRGLRNARRAERLMIAARTLGAERRMGPRMPLCCQVDLGLAGTNYPTTSIDIGRRGIMLARPGALAGPDSTAARVGIANVGTFAARVVALDAETISLAFQPSDGNPGHDGLMRLITSLERQNADAIKVSTNFANEIADAFAAELTARTVSVSDLFASDLRRMAGTDPPQFHHPAMGTFERVLPSIMARYQGLATDIAYAVATSRNCFVPIHIAELSHRQRPDDLHFNHAFSRHRRVYDDRWTLRAAAFSQQPVVQTYRRDIPDGAHRLVRDVSAPIFVRNRHWGAAQIAYRLTDDTSASQEPAKKIGPACARPTMCQDTE